MKQKRLHLILSNLPVNNILIILPISVSSGVKEFNSILLFRAICSIFLKISSIVILVFPNTEWSSIFKFSYLSIKTGNFSEYIKAKKTLFDELPRGAFALINIDDKNGPVMVQNTKAKVITYSNRAVADFHCKVLEYHLNGMLL